MLIPQDASDENSPNLLSERDEQWLETFEVYIRKNIADDRLNVPHIAYHFAMSISSLSRQLKRLTGLSPAKYLQEVRLDRARQLLENRTLNSVAKVAEEVGYADFRSFSRGFKKRFGKSPSDFF